MTRGGHTAGCLARRSSSQVFGKTPGRTEEARPGTPPSRLLKFDLPALEALLIAGLARMSIVDRRHLEAAMAAGRQPELCYVVNASRCVVLFGGVALFDVATAAVRRERRLDA